MLPTEFDLQKFCDTRPQTSRIKRFGAAAFCLSSTSRPLSLVPLELPFSPMGVLAIGIKHALDVTVQRLHDPNPRHHRRTASRYQHRRLDRDLPFRQVCFLLRKLGDVVGR